MYIHDDYVVKRYYQSQHPGPTWSLSLHAEGYSTGGDPIDPNDRWTDHETEYIELTSLSGYPDTEGNGIPVTFDVNKVAHAYAVVVRYTTGDTFGSSEGNVLVADVYEEEWVAQAHVATIKGIGLNPGASVGKVANFSYDFQGRPYLAVWEGYFESLDDAVVMPINIWPTPPEGGKPPKLTIKERP